jgi:hypothetical protein
VNALDEQLGRAFDDEPPIGNAVDAVFRRVEQLRKRRIRRLLLIGLCAVVLVAGLGYGLTSALLPTATGPARTPGRPADRTADSSAPTVDRQTTTADAAAATLARISGLTVEPRDPAAGPGWRQYSVFDAAGQSRGTIEIAAFWKPDGLCLPVLADPKACALPQHSAGLEYARYAWDNDVDWQLTEAIARRLTDGRTIAVLATGRRNTGDAGAGRSPLTGRQSADAATDPGIVAMFGAAESCDDPAVSCPQLRAKVPAG